MRYIIVGNSLYKTFHKTYSYQNGDYLIGLDEGSMEIIKKDLPLNEAWGDFDSGNNLNLIKSKAIKLYEYPKMKNETDLELLLMNLNVTCEIVIYDITGARLDHELINILLLRKYKNLNISIIDELNEIKYYYLPKEYVIKKDQYNYVSILTLDKVTISITEGLYKLNEVTITKDDTYTTSNGFVNNNFKFQIHEGELILIRSK